MIAFRKYSMTVIAGVIMALAAMDAGAQTVGYDTLGRVTRVGYGGSTNVTCGYDAAGNITNIAYSGTLAEPDLNANSMPDMWEWIYFNNLTNTAAGDPNRNGRDNLWEYQNGYDPLDPDSDGDHSFNWDEITAGTDPFSATSVFQVSGLRSPVSGPVVEWSSITNKHYRVQRSTHLPDGFGDLRTNILATPTLNVYTDETATGTGPYHYRVELE